MFNYIKNLVLAAAKKIVAVVRAVWWPATKASLGAGVAVVALNVIPLTGITMSHILPILAAYLATCVAWCGVQMVAVNGYRAVRAAIAAATAKPVKRRSPTARRDYMEGLDAKRQESAMPAFESVAAAAKAVPFCAKWHNGTGYFNVLVDLPFEQVSTTTDDYGRKVVVVPFPEGNVVLFERYPNRGTAIMFQTRWEVMAWHLPGKASLGDLAPAPAGESPTEYLSEDELWGLVQESEKAMGLVGA